MRRLSPRAWRRALTATAPAAAHLATAPIEILSLPPQLVIPLSIPPATAQPLVEPGQRVLRGQPIARSGEGWLIQSHASTSGSVRTIEQRRLTGHADEPVLCCVLDADGLDEAVAPLPALGSAEVPVTLAGLRLRLAQAGIVGLGGAGFPTAAKLAQPVDTLIVNGVECDPAAQGDDALLQSDAIHVLAGARLLTEALGAGRCLLAISAAMRQAAAALQGALRPADDIELRVVPALYPLGAERLLIRELTGLALAAAARPSAHGVLCLNAATVQAVHAAVVQGRPLTERLVSISGLADGAIRNLQVRIGTPIAALLAHCGIDPAGASGSAAYRVGIGGAYMGRQLPDWNQPVLKTTTCIEVARSTPVPAPQPCIRCGQCAEVCPVGLLPHALIRPALAADPVSRRAVLECLDCGLCTAVCPAHIPLAQRLAAAKADAAEQELAAARAAQYRGRHVARQQRLARAQSERRAALAAHRGESAAAPMAPDAPVR